MEESKGTLTASDFVEQLLTGGNHLASVLIGRLGAGDDTFPPYQSKLEDVEKVLSAEDLDLWICWRGIMLFRDAWRDGVVN
jgi:hypothetical protein